MPTIKISPLGVSGGFSGGNGREYGERQSISGWTAQSARGNTRFLRSVCADKLPGFGLACTLTIRDLPTPQEWMTLRKYLSRYLSRSLGCVCWHMVTEWTVAGRPHLHVAVFWFEHDVGLVTKVQRWWLKATSKFGTAERAQKIRHIIVAEGWFAYTAKHASRGMAHYQRQVDTLPEDWKGNTGRVWGKGGRWITSIEENEVSKVEFYRFRRWLDNHAMASAVQDFRRAQRYGDVSPLAKASKRIQFLKKLRKSFGEGRQASLTRGINQWVPQSVSSPLLMFAATEHEGYEQTLRDFHASLAFHGLTKDDVPY